MPMRITCPNCGKQFSAWDDLVGKAVECPKCHQKTVIAGPNAALETPPPAPRGRPAEQKSVQKPVQKPPVPAPPPKPQGVTSPKPPKNPPVVSNPRSPVTPPPAASSPPKVATTKISRPVPEPNFDDDESLPNGCPNCNATMAPNDDLCDACGYHLVLKKVIDISDMPKKNQSTGFERLLKEQLHDPESTANTMLWFKIAASLICVVILFVCLGRWWWVGVLILAGIGGLLWMKRRSHGGDESVNHDPLSAVIWTILLGIQRVLGWRKLQWPFSKARSLILNDPAFNDKELSTLDRLSDLEALDLEGTGITDASLENLRPLKQLRFLVLRKTQVTPAVAQKLQQDLPKTMIWI
jgi:DNA-directed RNA polymerase subunit RPC12/RpoP